MQSSGSRPYHWVSVGHKDKHSLHCISEGLYALIRQDIVMLVKA
jgi:hypothetical protein